jgi:hypothetical protein
VYSSLPFPPAVQTRCSEGEDGHEEFFDEEFYAMCCPGCYSGGVMEFFVVPFCKRVILVFRDIIPGCYSGGVMEFFVVPFCKRVILVFRDIIYVINILYLWHLA